MQLASFTSVLLLAGAATAQGFLHLPASTSVATTELPNYALPPFAHANSRVQMFFAASEVGASTFTANALSLRWDGPLPQVGSPGPFTIQRLVLKVGATSAALPGASFAQNLSQPLVTVLDGPWSYFPDPGFGSPHAWGAPTDSLKFSFPTPVTVAIPAGGWFVVELAMHGNNLTTMGFAHTMVDGVAVQGGPATGVAVPYGQGCSIPGRPPATIGTTGVYAPGAAHFVNGQNLGANAPVFVLLGLDQTNSPFGPLPFTLPGTSCQLLTSFEANWLVTTDATGSIPPGTQAAAFAVPPVPAFGGYTLYEQLLAYAPGANALDFVTTDAMAVTLGVLAAPTPGVYAVSNGTLADATYADRVVAFGYAVQLSTL